MLRILLAVMFTLAAAVQANAHPPGGEDSVFDTLSHQLLAAHHFPGMAALAAVLVVLIARQIAKHGEHPRR